MTSDSGNAEVRRNRMGEFTAVEMAAADPEELTGDWAATDGSEGTVESGLNTTDAPSAAAAGPRCSAISSRVSWAERYASRREVLGSGTGAGTGAGAGTMGCGLGNRGGSGSLRGPGPDPEDMDVDRCGSAGT
uniref:Uncharacterized protein n=1 Tax=Mycena chlorophos TaxID=658473 RepID=A0ABQ0L8U8_MYCCL|nr:predicted protein [Mycena chlorophos]